MFIIFRYPQLAFLSKNIISQGAVIMNRQNLKGNLLLLLTSVVWGISFIAQSKGVEQISPVAFNGIRCMLGALVLLPVIIFFDYSKKKKKQPIQKADKQLIIAGIICGTLLCIATTLQTAGMIYTSPGKSGFITALYMVFVPIIGLFTSKKPQPSVLISVVIALTGLYLMCMDNSLSINIGDVLTLFCAFVFAWHIIAIDYFATKVDGIKLSCLQFFVCGFWNLIWMFLFEEPELGPILNCWPAIGYSGIMSCGVAYTLQIIGQKYTTPTAASILMSLESVFATLTTVILVALGWDLTGGALSIREISGCIFMFIAIILLQFPERKNV